jgi:ribonuclease T1
MRWLVAALAAVFCATALAFLADAKATDLPREARETLARIKAGGPFPYARDGAVFGNREGLLPKRSRGYYREYTVKTPGAKDRGARRIVAGRSGELYYTDDHYRSFRRIIE